MNQAIKAIQILKQGKLVAIPTETVYGLAADANNETAVRKIFEAKGRPADHPLIVHIGQIDQLNDWAVDIPEIAWQLAVTFWPGPLTLILKKAHHVSSLITGGQDTVGIRMPNHPLTLELLREFNGAVCAPSANRFGHISPTKAAHVQEELGERVELILEGGACDVGIESTILDLSQDQPTLLRPGHIKPSDIEAIIGTTVSLTQKNSPRVSGSLASHYAPTTKTQLISKENIKTLKTNNIGLLCFDAFELNIDIIIKQLSQNPNDYAHDLYAKLRELDELNLDCIYIEEVPSTDAWLAVKDRIGRASHQP